MKNLLYLFCLLCCSSTLFAQKGFIRGSIIDEAGEPAVFATIMVVETNTGTPSDMDGKFSLELEPGTYSLLITYIGFADKRIEGIVVTPDNATILDVVLTSSAIQTEELVIHGQVKNNTSAALNRIKSKAAVPLDGIDNITLRKIGGSQAAEVIKSVTGVSVQGGKYVFVRGLGDRYTKTILNGMDIPGLDPDRNTIQMDIFPSNLIENIYVYKAFSPDLPGDFAGGVVNLVTKEFPEQKSFNISLGVGYNPAMHFNSNALAATTGNTAILGFDNSSDLPIAKDLVIPDPANSSINPNTDKPYNEALPGITTSFNPQLAPTTSTTPMNYNFALSTGNQFQKSGSALTFGYNAALNYINSTTHFEDARFNTYVKNNNVSINELALNTLQEGALSSNNVLLSGMLGGAVKWGYEETYHKISANVLRIQNGESTAGRFLSEKIIDNSAVIYRDNIEYTERSITNAILKGTHSFDNGNFEVEWKLSPTISTIYDKDVRITPLRFDNNDYTIQPSEGAIPARFWRNLTEKNLASRVDVSKKVNLNGNVSTIQLGVSNSYKQRDYEILSYRTNVDGQVNLANPFVTDGDANKILSAENIWTPATDMGVYMKGNFEPTNTYDANQNILGAYAMGDLTLTKALRAVVGLRMETFQHYYTGQNNTGSKVYDNEKIIDALNVLPSVNIVYTLKEDKNAGKSMNLRLGYASTIARPSFKEASIAEIYDAISNRNFIGNIDIEITKINNFDLRWEYFQPNGQLISLSAFYKQFTNPIELVAYDATAPNSFQPRNVGNATVLGIELEAKKNLSFISSSLEKLSLGTNLTLVEAEVELDEATYQSRLLTARVGETIDRKRAMQGQSPYIINAFLSYDDAEKGVEANLSYNVQGPSLFIVGINTNPDVYEKPFNSLNFNLSKRFGAQDASIQHKLTLRVQNILDAKRQKVYQSYMAEEQLFEFFAPSRTIAVSYSLSF
jgi:TonB-dependent receptor